jgi:prepilin-type processing-associated H-X9-DG protein
MLYTGGYAEYQALTCDSRREAMTMEEFLDGLDDPSHRHSNYVYVGTGLTSAVAPKSVLVYEHLRNHRGDGINVLYADGMVAWLDDDAAAALIVTLPPSTSQPATAPAGPKR